MFRSIKAALESFSRDPVPFMLPCFVYVLFMAITLGAGIGAMLLAFLAMAALSVDSGVVVMVLGAVAALAIILYAIFSAGYKGALYNEFYNASNGEKVGLSGFMQYAFKSTIQFFAVSVVKLIVMGFLLSPLAVLYYFLDLGTTQPIIAWFVILIALCLIFVVEFLFSFTYIAMAVKKVGPFSAIVISLNFIKEANISALIVYMLYCMVVIGMLIPLLNVFVYFVFYPIACTALIKLFEQRIGGGYYNKGK